MDKATYDEETAKHEEQMRLHVERMKAHDEAMLQMQKDIEESKARAERMIRLQAKKTYQREIHGVAINVLVALLTKDALRAMRESEFTPSKIDVGSAVEFSLIVGKRYVDELHSISVSEKQIEEYKDQLVPPPPYGLSSPYDSPPLITPPPAPQGDLP